MDNTSLQKSPTWGLNTSQETCFWCRKPTGRKVLHGLLPNDVKADTTTFSSYKPCTTCETDMTKGITIIQCTTEPNANMPLAEGLYPTGCWVTISESWIRSQFKPEAADKIIEDKAVNVTLDLWDRLGLPNLTQSKIIASPLEFKETIL